MDTIDMSLWLDANDSSTLIIQENRVENWLDKSGQRHHASQLVSELQPIFSSDAIIFNGTQTLDIPLNFIGEGSHTAFIVLRNQTYSNIYGAALGGQGYNSLHIGFQDSSTYRMNIWGNDDYFPITRNFKHRDWNLLQFNWIIGEGKSVYANGQLEGSSTQWYKINNQPAGGGRLVGVCGDVFTPMQCELREIIVLMNHQITPKNCSTVQTYLQTKWGL